MIVTHARFLSLVYHDLFHYPLTRAELEFWQIGNQIFPKQKIDTLGDFCFLQGRGATVLSRTSKTKTNDKKYLKALKAAGVLQKIPTIEMIAISGALAMGNAKADDDIDLFIVTSVDCLWITRLVSYVLLKFADIPVRKVGDANVCDKICLNLWVDANHLAVPTRDIYSAHEILQVKILFDRGGKYEKFLRSNGWVAQFFPVGFDKAMMSPNFQFPISNFQTNSKFQIIRILSIRFVRIFEAPARILQWNYMRNKKTREKVGRGYAFFHPKSWREMIVSTFLHRLEGMLVGKSTSLTSAVSN